MAFRGVAATAACAVSALGLSAVLTGCSVFGGPPEPTPMFTSEEEAYAAAEQVFREYITALNDGTLEPREMLDGAALESELDGASIMNDRGWVARGESVVVAFEGTKFTSKGRYLSILAEACLDSTNVRVFDMEGRDVTPAQREDVAGLALELQPRGARLKIVASRLGGQACER